MSSCWSGSPTSRDVDRGQRSRTPRTSAASSRPRARTGPAAGRTSAGVSPRVHSDANTSAATISARSCTSVAEITRPGGPPGGDVAAARLDPRGDQQVGDRRDDERGQHRRQRRPQRDGGERPRRVRALGRDDALRHLRVRVQRHLGLGRRNARHRCGSTLRTERRQLGERGDPEHARRRVERSVAVDQHRGQARRARAADVGLDVVADVQRLLRRSRPRARARARRSPGPAWAPRPRPRRARRRAAALSPVASSCSCSETSQLETTTSRTPAARSARSAGTASGNGSKRIAASSASVSASRSSSGRAERVAQHLRARAPQRRQAGRVAPHPQVRAVVGDLGLHRRAPPRPRRPRRRAARAAPRAGAARAASARAACRARRS